MTRIILFICLKFSKQHIIRLIRKLNHAPVCPTFCPGHASFIATLLMPVFCFSQEGTFTDTRDNTIYKTVKIGNQLWMAENLKLKTETANPYNNNTSYINTYGFLYEWEDTKSACPSGWHIPTQDEWKMLISTQGGKNIAGGKLKQKGTLQWKAPNRMGTNASKFTALPGGVSIDGEFEQLGEASYFWGTEAECTSGYVLYLSFRAGFADSKMLEKTNMASIRCIKD